MIEPVAVLVVVLIAAGAVAFVALPFLRRPAQARENRRKEPLGLALLERRDRALGALKELEFDHRTGKISDDDYRALLGPLRRDAAEALQLLKAARMGRVEPGPVPYERRPRQAAPSQAAAAKQHR
jgi:hypothetical protein